MKYYFTAFLIYLSISSVSGQKTFYWKAGSDNNASNAANWHQSSCGGATGILPGVNDTIVFSKCSGSSYNCTVDLNLSVNKIDVKSSYTATITMGSGKTFTAKTMKLGGGNFIGSDGNISCTATLTLQGTNFTSTSSTLTIQGTLNFKSGSFSHNNGKVIFNKSKNTISNTTAGTLVFYDLEITGKGKANTIEGAIVVTHTMTTSGTKSCNINADISGGSIELNGDLQWNNTATSSFGNVNWKFTGTNIQNVSGAVAPTLANAEVNKSDKFLLLKKELGISGVLTLTNGFITSDSINCLTIQNGGSIANASATRFIRGAIKKVGNSAFTFPIGVGWKYRPVQISAPAAGTDAFLALYHSEKQNFGDKKDADLSYLSQCEYWTLTHPAGTSTVTVKLLWDPLTCDIDTLPPLRIARWNSGTSTWNNTGSVTTTGDTLNGTIITSSAQSSFGFFMIAKSSLKPVVNAGTDKSACIGTVVKLGANPTVTGGTPPYIYSWTPLQNIDSISVANPGVIVTGSMDYILMVTDAREATVSDTVHITAVTPPQVEAGADRYVAVQTNTTLGGTTTVTGGTPPYSYSWSPSTYLNSTVIDKPTAAPLSSIAYFLTVTDANGCQGKDGVSIILRNPSLGLAGTFALFSKDTITSSSVMLVPGKVGSRKFLSSNIRSADTITVQSAFDSLAAIDLDSASSRISAYTGTSFGTELGGLNLSSGAYNCNAKATLNGTLTLTGDANSLFIINLRDSFVVSNNAQIVLSGVNKSQVYIRVGQGMRVAGTATLAATFIVEKGIKGGTINNASLLGKGKIQLTAGSFSPSVIAVKLTSVSRSDAAEFLGFNGSNTIQASSQYQRNLSELNFRTHVPLLNGRVVRFPAGGLAKTWDSNNGWMMHPDEFIDTSAASYSPLFGCLPLEPNRRADQNNLPVNRMLELKYVTQSSDIKALYVTNLFANSGFEESVLKHALELGVNVPYIELGNEFYLRGQTCSFNQPEDYASTVNDYMSMIHNNPAFAGMKVGFVGSSWSTEENTADETACRRKTWNAGILPHLTNTQPGDAITYHIYPTTGIDISKAPKVTLADIPGFMAHAYDVIDRFATEEVYAVTDYPDLDIWVTEMNLTDKVFIVHGSWAQSLFLSTMTMRLLEFPRVKFALIHSIANDASRAMFFTSDRGYAFGELWETIDSNQLTQPWALTANGLSVKMITDAMRYSSQATMLQFPGGSNFSGTTLPTLYGWTFDKNLGDKQTIIMNLSGETQAVDISKVQPASAYEQIFCKDPLYYITGKVHWNVPYNDYYNSVTYDYNTKKNSPVNYDSLNVRIPANTSVIYLPPYSITRLYVLNNSGVWLRQTSNSICGKDDNSKDKVHSSGATNLYASGGASYKWTIGDQVSSEQSSVGASPNSSVNNGGLSVYDPEGNLLGTKNNISVSVLSLPAVNVTPTTFTNGNSIASFTATASGAINYNWNPTLGLSSISGSSVTVTPRYSTNYQLIGTDANHCSKIAKFTATISPTVTIHSSNGYRRDDFLPSLIFICRGDSITLTADGPADQFQWSSADGSVNSQDPSITLTPLNDMYIILKATDNAKQATSQTSVNISLRPNVFIDFEEMTACANTFANIHAELNDGTASTTFCWDDGEPGTLLYEKKNLTKPITENLCKTSYDKVFLYAPAGDYTATVTGQDPNNESCPGNSNTDQVNIHVMDLPSFNLPSNPCVINGGSVTLTVSGNEDDFTWTGPNLTKSVGSSIQVSPTVNSSYTVTSSNQGCCKSATINVTVNAVTANCDGSDYCYGCDNKVISVTPFDPANYNYQWYEGGVLIPGATDGNYTIIRGPLQLRQTSVYCAVSKINGSCSAGRTNDVQVTLKNNCKYSKEELALSSSSQNISVYPNPAENSFSLEFAQEGLTDEKCSVAVYDLFGKLQWIKEVGLLNGSFSQQFNSDLHDGIYLLRICTSQGCDAVRLVISH